MNKQFTFSLLLTFILLLTACGGGSSSDKPTPEPVPAPTISSFTASKTTIMAGESIELTTVFSNGTASIDNSVGSISSNTAKNITPKSNTTYTLTVTNSAGTSVTAKLTVEIISPQIASFKAYKTSILAGKKAYLTAIFSNGVATIDNNVGTLDTGKTVTVSPKETTTYTLTVTNEYGTKAIETLTIEVVPIVINFFQPNTVSHNRVIVGVTIESDFEIDQVSASINELTTQLEYVPTDAGGYYGGSIYLTSKPPGKYPLTVTAIDVLGNSNSATKEVILDNPPEITLSSPLYNTVATPEVLIDLSCSDDVSDTEITIRLTDDWQDGAILTSGVNQIQGTFDLTAYNGHAVTLNTECKDSSNQTVTTSTAIYVESSEKLVTVKDFSAQLADYDHSRVLVHNTSTSNASLTIANINSNEEETVDVAPDAVIVNSLLTPTGAVYQAVNYNQNYDRRSSLAITSDWNNGELLNLGWTGVVSAKGNFLSFIQDSALWQRELLNKANTWVSGISTHRYQNENDYSLHDIAKNGAMVYNINAQWYVSDIKKYHSDHVTTFSYGRDPITDGTISVYLKINRVTNANHAIAMHDGNNEVMLTEYYDSFELEPHTYYAVTNGWVAYADLGNTEQTHIWTRDTQGNLAQRTFFASSSLIDTLAENGELMLTHDNKRYLSKPNEELILIGSTLGKSKYLNGQWYIAIGRTLFQVNLD